MDKGFENKIVGLLSLTRGLDIPHLLLLRRMTMADEESLHWASPRQLHLIFNVIVQKTLEALLPATLIDAQRDDFEPLLPSEGKAEREAERSLLAELSAPILAAFPAELFPPPPLSAFELLRDPEPPAPDSFEAVFSDALIAHLRETLGGLACAKPQPKILPPFLLAPRFATVYERVVRALILPTLRKTRPIRELAKSCDWQHADGKQTLREIIANSTGRNNPVGHYWDGCWDNLSPERAKGEWPNGDPWAAFVEDATEHHYIAPTPDDLATLRHLLVYDGQTVRETWNQIAQIYRQEFKATSKADQARPGAFRDALVRTFDKLEDHSADLLTIRAFYDLPKVDKMFLKRLIQSLGRSDTERDHKAPILLSFFNALPR